MNKKFVADYNTNFHRNPDMFSVGGYDGMHVIYESLKKTNGDTNGDKLIAAAKGLKWESPRGPMMIDPETRDAVETMYIREVKKVDGKLVNVDIDEIKEAKDPWYPRNVKK
jgi:branched-chain amino acid transport system substrate-binding protein